MHITYYGHSAFLIAVNGGTLLFDPFISDNPLSKGKVNIEDIKTDAVLVSHGHWDHTGDAADIAKMNAAPLVAIVEVAAWFEKKGVTTKDLNFGGQTDLGFAKVRLVPAVHSSAMPDGTYGGNPAGFVVTHDEGVFYFSGDTALTSDMALIGARYKPDIAFLCMGDTYTMDVADALHAAQMLNVKRVVGMHYDTWPPIAINHEDAIKLFAAAGIELMLMPLQQSVAL
jgi:L-ascorbate metabolism protein UlaG (beta-lactamase superfamily)